MNLSQIANRLGYGGVAHLSSQFKKITGFTMLKNLRPNLKLIEEVSEELDLIGFYPFTLETVVAGHDASSRMFGPRYAIPEEAGTGMAAGPLASYSYDRLCIQKQHMLIEQGWYMSPPSPSIIEIDLEISYNKIQRIMAGGKGVVSNRLDIENLAAYSRTTGIVLIHA